MFIFQTGFECNIIFSITSFEIYEVNLKSTSNQFTQYVLLERARN